METSTTSDTQATMTEIATATATATATVTAATGREMAGTTEKATGDAGVEGKGGGEEDEGTVVELNVYDLQHPDNPEVVPRLNWYLSFLGCGIYHSGCVVHGVEYAYGGHAYPSTGIFHVSPKEAPGAKFKQTVYIGRTHLTRTQVYELIEDMSQLWAGNCYNLLSKNCNHFASDLCERLTGQRAPEWINRLAWMAERAKFLLPPGFDQPTMAPVVAPSIDRDGSQLQQQQQQQQRNGNRERERDRDRDRDPELSPSSSLLNSDYDFDDDFDYDDDGSPPDGQPPATRQAPTHN